MILRDWTICIVCYFLFSCFMLALLSIKALIILISFIHVNVIILYSLTLSIMWRGSVLQEHTMASSALLHF